MKSLWTSLRIYIWDLKDQIEDQIALGQLACGTSKLFPREDEASRELCLLIKPALHPRSLGMSPSNTSNRLPGKTPRFITASANIDLLPQPKTISPCPGCTSLKQNTLDSKCQESPPRVLQSRVSTGPLGARESRLWQPLLTRESDGVTVWSGRGWRRDRRTAIKCSIKGRAHCWQCRLFVLSQGLKMWKRSRSDRFSISD